MIRVFDYTDYRQYLKDIFLQSKESKGQAFSLRNLARMANFSSGYLTLILNGKRNLSFNAASRLTTVLKMKTKEKDYFETLVLFESARNEAQKKQCLDKLLSLQPTANVTSLEKKQWQIFSKPYLVAIHQMILLSDFVEDPEVISKRVYPQITPLQAKEAINVLLSLELVKRDKKGKLIHSHHSLSTPREMKSMIVYNYHYSAMHMAIKALQYFSSQVRDFTSLTVPVAASQIPALKERIAAFREETLEWLDKQNIPPDEIYHLGLQFFPVTLSSVKVKS